MTTHPTHRPPRRPLRLVLAACAVLALGAGTAVACAHDRPPRPAAVTGAPTTPASGPAVASAPAVDAAPSSSAAPSTGPSPTAPASGRPTPPPGPAPRKKGVSTYEFSGNEQALADVRASWYYNW